MNINSTELIQTFVKSWRQTYTFSTEEDSLNQFGDAHVHLLIDVFI